MWFWLLCVLLLGATLVGGYLLFGTATRFLTGLLEPEPLPAVAEERDDPVPTPPEVVERPPIATLPAPSPRAPDSELVRAERARAEELLVEFLTRRQALVQRGVEIWGGPEFEELLRLSETGDDALLQEDYVEATEVYRAALRILDALEADLPQAFDRLMRDGARALEQGDGENARRSFDAARRIEPDHAEAEAGYRRAQTIERVMALLQAGTAKESANRLALALADYQEAVRLDPLSSEAAAGVQRVSAAIRQNEFRDLMSQGLVALRAGDLDRAETLIRKARDIEPDAPAVREAMQQVQDARKAQRIREFDDAARAAEAREDWASASQSYAAILEINPLIRSAQEGRNRANERRLVMEEAEVFLADPALLSTPEGRARGQHAQSVGRRLGPAGPNWNEQFAKLDALVERATTPVRVTLRSDGQTSIDVYRVGRFARVAAQEILVAPGTYTVVGHRPGFRDTRLTLHVPVGGDSFSFEVICRDPIR